MTLAHHFVVSTAALDGGSSPLPAAPSDWQKYHVIVLGDVKANAFTAEQLRIIRDMVRDMGKGLMVLGGLDSFGQGGWPGSPIDQVMPMELSEAAGQFARPFALTPTAQGLRHELMRLKEDASENARMWSELPTIGGANRLPDADRIRAGHPGAIILATMPSGQPVMVAQQAGRGRVLAMAVDTTWRWRMHLDEGRELHDRFWRQVIQWLSNRRGNVWVTTDQPRYRLSQVRLAPDGDADRRRIIVRAGLEDETGRPVRDDQATLTEFMPPVGAAAPQTQSIALGSAAYRDDRYEVELPPPSRDGSYRLLLQATLNGQSVQAETSFLVESTDLELSRPLANFDLLRAIASAGKTPSSRFYALDEFGDLLDSFRATDYLIRREELRTTELGDRFRWPLLALGFSTLLLEWVLRKRRNLV